MRYIFLCLVDCQWSDWNSWSSCSEKCGGQKSRNRTKLQIAQNGGKECIGPSDDCSVTWPNNNLYLEDKCPSKQYKYMRKEV